MTNEIGELCKKTKVPVYLTKNSEGDLVVLDIESFTQQEKMLQLRENLLVVEEEKTMGHYGCSIDEVENYLDSVLNEA